MSSRGPGNPAVCLCSVCATRQRLQRQLRARGFDRNFTANFVLAGSCHDPGRKHEVQGSEFDRGKFRRPPPRRGGTAQHRQVEAVVPSEQGNADRNGSRHAWAHRPRSLKLLDQAASVNALTATPTKSACGTCESVRLDPARGTRFNGEDSEGGVTRLAEDRDNAGAGPENRAAQAFEASRTAEGLLCVRVTSSSGGRLPRGRTGERCL